MISPQNDIIQAPTLHPSSQNLTKQKNNLTAASGSTTYFSISGAQWTKSWFQNLKDGFLMSSMKVIRRPQGCGRLTISRSSKTLHRTRGTVSTTQQAGMSSVGSTQPWLNHVMTVGFRCKGCKWHGQPAVKPSHVLSLKWRATRRCQNQRWLKSPAAIAEHQGTPSPPAPPFPTACLSGFALC